jgi:DNA adenine methylase
MNNEPNFLPRDISPKAPPIKTQGIKTKLVPLIARSILWNGEGRWIEPFLGSGVVALNIAPKRALLADSNQHLIKLYRSIQSGDLHGPGVREYLAREGAHLFERGEDHFYFIRDRFNEAGNSLDFLFLSRACFNGMMRFNRKGGFNVPFCRKPERFRPALITKIVNQVEWARRIIAGKDWTFVTQDWRTTLSQARTADMIYCDPPYVGRHTDYYNSFTDNESDDLAEALIASPADFALSNWLENKYRRNEYIERWFSAHSQRTISHFYYVGPSEDLRNEMTEVVVLSKGATAPVLPELEKRPAYLPLFEAAEAFNI